MKIKTLDQVEAMQKKAVRFVRDVLGDDVRAEEIEAEDPEDYAARKRVEIIENPHRRHGHMPTTGPTKAELAERVEELESENEELRDKLESIGEILDDDSEEDDDEEADDDGSDYE